MYHFHPALTGSKEPPSQDLERNRKIDGGTTARKSPIGSAHHQWGMKKTPTDGSFTLLVVQIPFFKITIHYAPNIFPSLTTSLEIAMAPFFLRCNMPSSSALRIFSR